MLVSQLQRQSCRILRQIKRREKEADAADEGVCCGKGCCFAAEL